MNLREENPVFDWLRKRDKEVDKIEKVCPICGNILKVREGRYGKFYGCSSFPRCNYTENIHDEIELFVGDERIEIQKFISIVSGKQECFRCKKETKVSGLGLLEDEIRFLDSPQKKLQDYGYDLYIFPWSKIFEQLPENLKQHVLTQYPVQYKYSKTIGARYYANVCEHCGVIQGDFYVYEDTWHGSPFNEAQNTKLIVERIALKNQGFIIKAFIESEVSPSTDFKSRIQFVYPTLKL